MKKLNLGIKLYEEFKGEDNKTVQTSKQVAIFWIGVMIERAINKPNPTTRTATKMVGVEDQRKYVNLINVLENSKTDIVELEDELFNYLDKNFHEATYPLQKLVSRVLVEIDDAINLAKVVKKENPNAKGNNA